MSRVCQVSYGVFASALAASLVAAVVCGTEQPRQPAPAHTFAHLVPWAPRPFADVALDDPDLAACFTISPGMWSTATPPTATLDESAIGEALATQLRGLVDARWVPPRRLRSPPARSGRSPRSSTATPGSSWSRRRRPSRRRRSPARLRPQCSPPRSAPRRRIGAAASRCSRSPRRSPTPARSPWRACRPPCGRCTTGSSQRTRRRRSRRWRRRRSTVETPWHERRAGLARLASAGGASPPFAAAAAFVVETFGDAARARSRPYDLLLAWREGSGKEYPAMPRALRSALGKTARGRPAQGEGKGRPRRGDARRAGAPCGARRLRPHGGPRNGGSLPPPGGGGVVAHHRCGGAVRVVGAGPASGGTHRVPAARVRRAASSSRARGTAASRSCPGRRPAMKRLLVVWPRWLLFPVVRPTLGELWFVDAEGVWRLPLDGHAAPRLAAPGAFRHLAPAPEGAGVATARWPGGRGRRHRGARCAPARGQRPGRDRLARSRLARGQ